MTYRCIVHGTTVGYRQRLFSIALTIPDTAAILEAVNMLEESEDLIQKPAT